MYTVQSLLLIAGVKHSVYSGCAAGNVYITDANQLLGTYENVDDYRKSKPEYRTWQTHHIVEDDDLDRLRINLSAPAYKDQLCVLIPERAHVGRINSILRRENPTRYQATAKALRRAYAEAYSMIGDYCGGGEAAIKRELMAIVDAQFQVFGVI